MPTKHTVFFLWN